MKYHRLALIIGITGLLPLAVQAGAHKSTKNVTETKELDTGVFTGTIQSIDAGTATVTVSGHEVFREEKIQKTGGKSDKPAKEAKPKKAKQDKAAKDVTRTFQVPALCKISTANKPSAFLADLKTGDAVDVAFHALNTNANVADSIVPPQSR